LRASDLALEPPEARWLVRDLWTREAQGIVGGAPKIGKSWFGLDLAVSVASNTPCLGHFPVDHPGPTLVFLAEDTLPAVRARIQALCATRGLDIAALDLHVITAPVLRLDQQEDQERLARTLDAHRPHLLLLDPLVRLHRLDENNATEVSGLLGFLTELVRTYNLALALVHHASKKSRARPGQALRGSSDLHAWGASNAYLTVDCEGLLLTVEHRAAPAPGPVRLRLVSRKDGSDAHLEVVGNLPDAQARSVEARLLDQLGNANGPLLRKDLRESLRVNNHRLGEILAGLEARGRLRRTPDGWEMATLPPAKPPSPQVSPFPEAQLNFL
jgi:hypothetical protein